MTSEWSKHRFQLTLISNNYAPTRDWHTWVHTFTEQAGCDIAKLFFSELWTGKYWFCFIYFFVLLGHLYRKQMPNVHGLWWNDMTNILLESSDLSCKTNNVSVSVKALSHRQAERATTGWFHTLVWLTLDLRIKHFTSVAKRQEEGTLLRLSLGKTLYFGRLRCSKRHDFQFWSLCSKLWKNAHHNFPEPKVTCSDCFLCSSKSPYPKRPIIYSHKQQRKAANCHI